MSTLKGKTALVTGSTSGIGLAMAIGLAKQGVNIMVNGFGEKDAAIAAIKACGVEVDYHGADMSKPVEIEDLIQQTEKRFGSLDILVNNAGGSPASAVAEASPRFVDAILKLNMVGPLYMAQAAYPHMAAQKGGSIINIASVSGARPSPGTTIYGMAKAGLINMTQSLAQEWGRDAIRVNAIIAGLMTTENAEATYGDAAAQAAVGQSMPLGRMGTGDDLAGAVLWLSSEDAQWVSGARLQVDGGGERPYFLDLVKGG